LSFWEFKDFRVTLKRTNDILDDVENISKGISEPISSLSNMFGSASSLTAIAKILSMFRKKKKD
jgi:hypothetical protein